MLPYVHLNGKLQPYEEARLQLGDLGLLRGYGIFDYFLFRNRKAYFLEDYLDRFYRSAAQLELPVPYSREVLPVLVKELIRANAIGNGGIRLLLTGGYSPDGYTPAQPNFAMMQYPYPEYSPDWYEKGVKLMTYRHQRELPGIKSTNYLTGIFIRKRLQQANAPFVLYHDGEFVRESDRSNFLIVDAEGTLVAPAEKVLAGVTRKYVLQLARQMNVKVREDNIRLTELATAREAMLTSTTKGIMPVTTIDRQTIGTGRPGPLSPRLQSAFIELVTELSGL